MENTTNREEFRAIIILAKIGINYSKWISYNKNTYKQSRIWSCWLDWNNVEIWTWHLLILSLASSHTLLHPSISFFFLLLWFGMRGGCQMTSEFLCEEISLLFHLEKFYGCGWRVALQLYLQAPGPGLLEIWNRPWDLRLLEFTWRWPGTKHSITLVRISHLKTLII